MLRPTREFFTHLETSPLHILTYALHSWPLSSEGSLACHTLCDTWYPFIIVISKDPWHLHLLPSVWQWNCHTCFNDLCQSRPKIEFQSPACKQIWVPFSRVYSLPNTCLAASWDDRTENDDNYIWQFEKSYKSGIFLKNDFFLFRLYLFFLCIKTDSGFSIKIYQICQRMYLWIRRIKTEYNHPPK